jgi:hypothetical protein
MPRGLYHLYHPSLGGKYHMYINRRWDALGFSYLWLSKPLSLPRKIQAYNTVTTLRHHLCLTLPQTHEIEGPMRYPGYPVKYTPFQSDTLVVLLRIVTVRLDLPAWRNKLSSPAASQPSPPVSRRKVAYCTAIQLSSQFHPTYTWTEECGR